MKIILKHKDYFGKEKQQVETNVQLETLGSLEKHRLLLLCENMTNKLHDREKYIYNNKDFIAAIRRAVDPLVELLAPVWFVGNENITSLKSSDSSDLNKEMDWYDLVIKILPEIINKLEENQGITFTID